MLELLVENLPPAVRTVRKLYDLESGGYFIPMRHEMTFVDDSYIPHWRHKLPVLYDCIETPVADMLYTLVFNLKGRKVLETGTSRGFSTCHLAAAVIQQGGVVVTIDPFPAPWFLWRDSALAKSITHIPKSSENAVEDIERLLGRDQFDVMFLDSLHSYDHLAKEILLFDKYLRIGGLIVLHDTMYYDCLGLIAIEMCHNNGYEAINIPTHRSHDYKSRSPGITVLRKLTDDRERYPITFKYSNFTNGEQELVAIEGRSRAIFDAPLVDMIPAGQCQLRIEAAPQGIVDTLRRRKFLDNRKYVNKTIEAIRGLTLKQREDASFLEYEFIPHIGLNDEILSEQPEELSIYFGKGLHLWQYPNQLAPYLVWLSINANDVSRYLEIGCRWGGMTILTAEWLRASGANITQVIVVDPIEPSPFIVEYFEILDKERSNIEHRYLRNLSTDDIVRKSIADCKPDFVFIDGDHSFGGALNDHQMIMDDANIIVHHDIASTACPEIAKLWKHLRFKNSDRFEFDEFTQQYASVGKEFLGIGVMKRKKDLESEDLLKTKLQIDLSPAGTI